MSRYLFILLPQFEGRNRRPGASRSFLPIDGNRLHGTRYSDVVTDERESLLAQTGSRNPEAAD